MHSHIPALTQSHAHSVIQVHSDSFSNSYYYSGTHTPMCNFSTKSGPEFSYTLLERADHQYLNGLHLTWESRTGMCEVLTKSRLSFMYKMIQEIISMPRVDSAYSHNFMIYCWVFKDDESKTDAKTNSRHQGVRS